MFSMLKKLKNSLRTGPTLLLVILAGCFFTRLYRINYPLLDWHSWRQADTAGVTREYVKHNYSLLRPHYQDLSTIPSGLPNLEGDRMVEFPLVNWVIAQIIRLCPTLDVVIFSRFCSALISTLSCYLLFRLTWNWTKKRSLSLLTATFFAFLPFSIYFGRTILPEPYQICFCLATLLAFTNYCHRPHWSSWLLTTFSLALALLIKPTSIFIAPVLVLLAWQKWRWHALKRIDLWLIVILAAAPICWWRQYILQFPAGIPASAWLFNSNGIRLRPAWWRWLFWERLTKTWFGYLGLIFFLAGLIPEKLSRWGQKLNLTKFDWLTYGWGLSMFSYLVIFATGNVQHDYYQVILLPLVCIILGRGVIYLNQALTKRLTPRQSFIIIGLLIVGMLTIGWQLNAGKFNVNRWDYYEAGQLVDQLTPADALVIADGYGGDTGFLFATNRTGWPLIIDLVDQVNQGAQYLITTQLSAIQSQLAALQLQSQIPIEQQIIYQNGDTALIKLEKLTP